MDTFTKLLKQFVAFKSVSTTSGWQRELLATVNWLQALFIKHGFTVKVVRGFGNPIIIARYTVKPAAETALIYGHYDVQPAEKSEGWSANPFQLTVNRGRLVARGAADNKGQLLIHLVTIFDLIKEDRLAYNVVFMIEGNEESGSPKMAAFIKENRQLLAADFAFISDGELAANEPTIEAGYRGGFNCTLVVRTGKHDLHSGAYGGVAPSAAHELTTLLAKLYNSDNEITVTGFYDTVDLVDPAIKREHARRPFDEQHHYRVTGTKGLVNEPGVDPFSQVGLRPAIQITGLTSGFTAEGYRNSIPATASAKINFRLVKSQLPLAVMRQFKRWVAANLPTHADYELQFDGPHEGIKLDLANKYARKAAADLKAVYKKSPRRVFVGGAIPVVTLFNDLLKLPCVMIPLANEDCNMHGPNENFKISLVKKGLAFSRRWFGSPA